MKKYTITRKNLIEKEYSLAETEEIENNKNEIFFDEELENFLFELFKIAKSGNVKSNENTSRFIMDISSAFITNSVCIKIHIDKMEMQSMVEEIVSQYIIAIRNIKSKNYTIEEISVIVYEDGEDRVIVECKEENYNEILELGA